MNDLRVLRELAENISSSAHTLAFDLATAEKKESLDDSFVDDLAFSLRFVVSQARALEAVWGDSYGQA
jgi:hypothetical protein